MTFTNGETYGIVKVPPLSVWSVKCKCASGSSLHENYCDREVALP